MSPNTIFPLPKESDNPSEKVRKTSWDFDDTKKALVATTDTVVKEGNTDMVKKRNQNKILWRNPSLLLFQQKRKSTQSTKQRNHKSLIKQ